MPRSILPLKHLLPNLLKQLFSFEMVFVLFLFGGRYKNDPRFAWTPVDLTVLFLVISIITAIWILYKRRFQFRHHTLVAVALLMAFVGYSGISYLWTPSDVYSLQKLGYLGVLTFWAFTGCAVVIGGERVRTRRFLIVLFLFSLWVITESFIAYAAGERGQLVEALGGRYLGLGRVIGLGAIIVVAYTVAIARSRTGRVVGIIVSILYMLALLIVGGRGPLVATVVALLVPLYFGCGIQVGRGRVYVEKYVILACIALSISGAAAAYYAGNYSFVTLQRMSGLIGGEIGGSSATRLRLYAEAVNVWMDNPLLGVGIGGWPVVAGLGDIRMYPHNILLELLAEFGLVGLGLVVSLFTYVIYEFGRRWEGRKDAYGLLLLMILVNTIVNAMFTGDINDNRIVFTAMGLLVLRARSVDRYFGDGAYT